jgi:hypothetical protein
MLAKILLNSILFFFQAGIQMPQIINKTTMDAELHGIFIKAFVPMIGSHDIVDKNSASTFFFKAIKTIEFNVIDATTTRLESNTESFLEKYEKFIQKLSQATKSKKVDNPVFYRFPPNWWVFLGLGGFFLSISCLILISSSFDEGRYDFSKIAAFISASLLLAWPSLIAFGIRPIPSIIVVFIVWFPLVIGLLLGMAEKHPLINWALYIISFLNANIVAFIAMGVKYDRIYLLLGSIAFAWVIVALLFWGKYLLMLSLGFLSNFSFSRNNVNAIHPGFEWRTTDGRRLGAASVRDVGLYGPKNSFTSTFGCIGEWIRFLSITGALLGPGIYSLVWLHNRGFNIATLVYAGVWSIALPGIIYIFIKLEE